MFLLENLKFTYYLLYVKLQEGTQKDKKINPWNVMINRVHLAFTFSKSAMETQEQGMISVKNKDTRAILNKYFPAGKYGNELN